MTLSGLFISLFVAAVLVAHWRLIAQHKLSLRASRFYLLFGIAISALAPFASELQNAATVRIYLPEISISHRVTGWVPQGDTEWGWPIYSIWFVGAVIQFLPFLITIIKANGWKRESRREDALGFKVYISQIIPAPCTFLGSAFIPELSDAEKKVILNHELAHLRLGHKWDSIFILISRMFLWWNPFYWMLQSDLQLTHEKQADKLAVSESDTSLYKELLVEHAVRGRFAFAHQYSLTQQISERMKSLNTIQKSSMAWSIFSMILTIGLGTSSIFAQQSKPMGTGEVDVVPTIAGCEENDMQCFVTAVANHVVKGLVIPKDLPVGDEARYFVRFVINESAEVAEVEVVRAPTECENDETGSCNQMNANIRTALTSLEVQRAAMKDGKFVKVEYTIPILVKME